MPHMIYTLTYHCKDTPFCRNTQTLGIFTAKNVKKYTGSYYLIRYASSQQSTEKPNYSHY